MKNRIRNFIRLAPFFISLVVLFPAPTLAQDNEATNQNCIDTSQSDQQDGQSLNTAPVIKPIENQSVEVGSEIVVRIEYCDAERDVPGTIATGLPSGATLPDNGDGTRSFVWTPENPGEFDVSFIVYDENDFELQTSVTVTFTVTELPVEGNQLPVLELASNIEAMVGEEVSFLVAPDDPDGGASAVFLEQYLAGATLPDNLDGTRTFRWIPQEAGETVVKFIALDAQDSSLRVTETVTILVSGSDSNTAPFIEPLSAVSVAVGNPISVRVEPMDSDGTVPNVFVESSLAGSSFDDNGDGTRTFLWVPSANDIGTVTVTFITSDSRDASLQSSQTLEITVIPSGSENLSPQISMTSDQSIKVGASLDLEVVINDPDGTVPEVSIDVEPAGVSFTNTGPGTYVTNWMPELSDVGSYTVEITATDAEDPAIQTVASFAIVVTDGDEPPLADYSIVLDSSIPPSSTSPFELFVVTGQVIDLNDTGLPSTVEWTSEDSSGEQTGGGSLEVASDGSWTGEVLLVQGVNQITFTIQGFTAEAVIEVIFNGGYAFGGLVDIQPDVAYVDEPRDFTVRIALSDPQTELATVNLVQISDGSVVTSLTDDGDLGNGDEIEADSVYTGLFTLNESEAGAQMFQVQVNLPDGSEARSEPANLLVTEHLDADEVNEILIMQDEMQAQIDSAADDDLPSVIDAILIDLESDSMVAQAGRNEGGQGVWVVYENGIAGVLYTPQDGTKGGGGTTTQPILERVSSKGADYPIVDIPDYSKYCLAKQSPLEKALAKISGEDDNTIESNKVLAIAAQYFDWGENDDIPQMQQILADNGCFDVNYIQYATEGAGNVEDFKNLGDYGVILISSHGDSFYNGILSLWSDRFGWDGVFGQVVLHSNMQVTPANQLNYEDDLLTGRLVLWGDDYGIMPTFVSEYAGALPNSLVYMSICRGTWNASMAQAFLNQGAGSFLGYDDYVSVPFCEETGPPLLTALLEDDTTLEDAFVAGMIDPYRSDQAEFELFGADDLEFDTETLQDPGFESGNITQAWNVEGDARIITSLGESAPTEGTNMAIISTGLGFTTTSGRVEQNLGLCEESSTISFDWNFFSEEFLEYVGSVFQDSFIAVVSERDDPSNRYVMINETIDSLAASVAQVGNSFDQGDVYATGWQSFFGEIPEALRGKKVTLRFETIDVGDSIYDTAVLIDNITVDCSVELALQ